MYLVWLALSHDVVASVS